MASPGGHRPRSGWKPRDSVWVGCAVPRPVFEELRRQEAATGVYRTRIIASLVCEGLIGAVVDRELQGRQSQPPLVVIQQAESPNDNK